MISSFISLAILNIFLVLGLPLIVSTSILFQAPRDAPFSVAEPLLSASLVCPNGIQRLAGGIVLLVHGTGATGDQSWPATPFLHLLPAMRPGFDVCYINIPGRSQGDIQLSSEYVAYNIMRLAEKSVTRNVSVIGHSQGNLNIQWALTFWPSIRPLIQDYIAVAADFHGTLEGSLACTLVRLREEGCTAALLQQTSGSNFLKALLARGDKALVTTTSIYTLTDDVIQNEVGPNATSILPGAANYFLQQIKICGPSHVEGHISVLFDPAVFHLAFDAITHVGPASLERFDRRNCFGFLYGVGPKRTAFQEALALTKAIFQVGLSFFVEPVLDREPPLKPYAVSHSLTMAPA